MGECVERREHRERSRFFGNVPKVKIQILNNHISITRAQIAVKFCECTNATAIFSIIEVFLLRFPFCAFHKSKAGLSVFSHTFFG